MDAWDPKNFPIPRMATEYGFQAMPSFRSIKRVMIMMDFIFIYLNSVNKLHNVVHGIFRDIFKYFLALRKSINFISLSP